MASGSGCGSQPTTHTAAQASRQWQGQPDLPDAKFAIFAHTFRIDKQAGGQMWNCFLPRFSCPFLVAPSSSQSPSASSLPFAQFALISAAGAELSLRLPAESEIPPSFSPPSYCFSLSRFALAPHPVLGLSRLRASWPAAWSVSEFVAIIVKCLCKQSQGRMQIRRLRRRVWHAANVATTQRRATCNGHKKMPASESNY